MRASKNLNRLLSATVLTQQFIVSMDAYAATTTITTKDAAGATLTWVVTTTQNATTFVGMHLVCDGVAAAQCAAVLAASSSALVTNPALVVAISGNGMGTTLLPMFVTVTSPFPAGTNAIGTVSALQSGNWTMAINNTSLTAVISGTPTVLPGNVANTTPWLMTINAGGTSAAIKGASAS